MKAKKFFAAAAGAAMAFTLAACSGGGAGDEPASSDDPTTGGGEAVAEGGLVGVAMPTQTSERWIADGEAVESGLMDLGYDVDLQFANDDIPTQSQQIDQMITNGAEALIIAAIDGTALAPPPRAFPSSRTTASSVTRRTSTSTSRSTTTTWASSRRPRSSWAWVS